MRFNVLFFLLLLACLYLSLAQGSYENCCLKFVKKVRDSTMKKIVDYRMQVTDGSCNIPAVIFVLKQGRKFCADPGQQWVQVLMKKIKMSH